MSDGRYVDSSNYRDPDQGSKEGRSGIEVSIDYEFADLNKDLASSDLSPEGAQNTVDQMQKLLKHLDDFQDFLKESTREDKPLQITVDLYRETLKSRAEGFAKKLHAKYIELVVDNQPQAVLDKYSQPADNLRSIVDALKLKA